MNTPSASLASVNSIRNAGYSISTADQMFLLQVARKETVDTSLDAAMTDMSARLTDQQDLNKFLSSVDSRAKANPYGHFHMTLEERDLLKRVGFNCDANGAFIAPAYDTRQGGKITTLVSEAVPFPDANTRFFVGAEQLNSFKENVTKHITALSGSNEIQMLQVQRLMNSANEAMQAASAQLKSSHDIAMSIIRNLG